MEAILTAMPNTSLLIVDVSDSWPNGVTPTKYGILTVENRYSTRVACRFVGVGTAKVWSASVDTAQGGAFTGWKQLAIAEPPTEYNLPLSSEVRKYLIAKYSKTQDGVVIINLSFDTINDLSINTKILVATLPVGFRSPSAMEIPISQMRGIGEYSFCSLYVHDNGGISLIVKQAVTKIGHVICPTISFVAGS